MVDDNYEYGLDELYSRKMSLESRIDNFFGSGQRHEGDHNYQQLLEELSDVEELIAEYEDGSDC